VLARLLGGVTAVVVVATSTACTSDGGGDPPAQLDRIDKPAHVDQNRLGSQPGAVSDEPGG
jgi:hypothetical protein